MSEQLQDWRHIWLYAKCWYKQSATMKDLKVLIGHHSALKPKQVNDQEVLTVLGNIAIPYLVTEGNVVYRTQRVFADLIQVTQDERRPLTIEDVVHELLSVLRGVRVMEDDKVVINLGEPDYNLLPEPER